MAADSRTRTGSFRRWSAAAALLAASAFALLHGAVPSQAAPRAAGAALVAPHLPDSPAGRQLRWLLEASAQPPLSDAELRAHFSKWFLSAPGQSPAELNAALQAVTVGGLHLVELTLVQPNALAAIVTGRDGQQLQVTLMTDRTGRVDVGVLRPAGSPPQ